MSGSIGPWPAPPLPDAPAADLADFLGSAWRLEATARPNNAAAGALVDTVAGIVAGIEDLTRRPRGPAGRQKLLDATAAIVGGTLRAWGAKAHRPVAFDQSNTALCDIPGGRHAAKAVQTAMVSAGLLAFRPHVQWQTPFGGWGGKCARLWPMPALLEHATAAGLSPDTIKAAFVAPPPANAPHIPEPIKVRGIRRRGQRDATRLPPETLGEDLATFRAEVEQCNDFADTIMVDGCAPPRWFRVFGPSPKLAGRWYAAGPGNYQGLSQAERLAMRIDGEPVAELDLKAAHLSIMHGLLGLPPPEGDLYDIPGTHRAAVKAWIVAALGKGTPLKRWKHGTPAEIRAYDPLQLKDAICERYPFMRAPADAVRLAAGLNRLGHIASPKTLLTHRLQAIEAQAITGTMRALRSREGVLALPVHDSLIVPRGFAQVTAEALADAFQEIAGVRVRVRVVFGTIATEGQD